jgi:hypothetical protein
MAEQVDEYADIEDEMPTATYQSMEIEKGECLRWVGQRLLFIQWYCRTPGLFVMN